MYVLLISNDRDGEPILDAATLGPFVTVPEAQAYARSWREAHNVPGHQNDQPTAEENEAWTEEGWTFAIKALTS